MRRKRSWEVRDRQRIARHYALCKTEHHEIKMLRELAAGIILAEDQTGLVLSTARSQSSLTEGSLSPQG
jgi:hypothetical protein